VVDRVSSAPTYAAFQIDQLTNQRLVIERVCSPAIDEREQGGINFGFGL
jgi:hypothetical protein